MARSFSSSALFRIHRQCMNQRILIQWVSLVRRLLMDSEHPEVARVGSLGEVTYLVDEQVEQAEVEIYDRLLRDGPVPAGNRMRALRQAIQPYVGKNLLKTGMRCESRQYETYVDPNTETLVHLDGFHLDAVPAEPKDAPPADQAHWIFAHPRDRYADGRRVVELFAARDVSALSSEELRLLAKGYNWWGQHVKSFEVVKLGLAREPHRTEWLELVRVYAWNAFFQDLPRFLSACDACLTAGVGPAAFWHLLKADQFIAIATGERELEDFEWSPGDPILHPELLRPAAEAMEAALAGDPGLREQQATQAWVGIWNTRFAAVLQDPAFRHLGTGQAALPP
jgi:hypothetical protein